MTAQHTFDMLHYPVHKDCSNCKHDRARFMSLKDTDKFCLNITGPSMAECGSWKYGALHSDHPNRDNYRKEIIGDWWEWDKITK